MNKKYFKYLTMIGLVLGLAFSSYGQGSGDNTAGMLRAELERTDQLIEMARDAVRVSNYVRAEITLANAEDLQSQAWDEFRKNTVAGFKAAGPLTQQAREQAKSAISSARYTQQKQDVVLRKLERAGELLERIREQLNTRPVSQAMTAIYESADNNLRNAWEFYRSGEFSPALKLANQVETTIRKVANSVNRGAQESANFERHSDNVDQLIQGASYQIADCDSETAIKLVEQARELLESARDLAGRDQTEQAMDALKTAKGLATKAQLECSGFDGTLSERYERIRNEADRIGEMISADNEGAKQLMEQAREQLDLAAGFIEDGQTQQAAAALKAAQLTLKQIEKLLDVSTE